jgi:multiple sugar transport system permease protein
MRGRQQAAVVPAPRLTRWERRDLRTGILFILPWIIGFLGFTLYPMAKAFYYSCTDYNLLQPPNWIGLSNYATAFTGDPLFWQSLGNTVFYALLTLVPGTGISIGLALMLNAKARGQSVFRAIYFMPTVLPLVATSLVWSWILDPQYGYLNAIFRALGVASPPGWLADPSWTKPAFAIMSIWGMGQAIVIYLASLQGVPVHLLEAAELDGAGSVRRFWHVTLPMISPAVLFNVVLSLIGTFQFFTQPFVMLGGQSGSMGGGTVGGPLQSALFYSPYLWQTAFSSFQMGYASALAWILFVVIMLCTGAVLYVSRHRVYYEGAV